MPSLRSQSALKDLWDIKVSEFSSEMTRLLQVDGQASEQVAERMCSEARSLIYSSIGYNLDDDAQTQLSDVLRHTSQQLHSFALGIEPPDVRQTAMQYATHIAKRANRHAST